MNGSRLSQSPAAADGNTENGLKDVNAATATGGEPVLAKPPPDAPTTESLEADADADADGEDEIKPAVTAAGDEGAASEAETLINSPVKKKEAEKKQGRPVNGRAKKTHRHRIGGLPVPSGDGDDENDSSFSPAVSVERPASPEDRVARNEGSMDVDSEGKGDDSDDLSQLATDDSEDEPSRPRGGSERPGVDRSQWQNPRKRKHRASSVSLPNKRPSIDAPMKKGRTVQSDGRTGKSPSPQMRSHRRAVSTQSTAAEAAAEGQTGKRRPVAQAHTRDSKSAKATWEESDGSSEATSHGHAEVKRTRRGIGRSTSTPGRPSGREHKRHVNMYGFTRLAEACEVDDLESVKEWRQKDPEQLELAEFAGNKPLQIAALRGHSQIVDYLIEQGVQVDCANLDKDTPLIDAAENGHLDVVKSLLRAGVDPLRQNTKGQHALDVVTDETDDADAIRAALRDAIDQWNSDGAQQKRNVQDEQRRRAGPSKELHLMAPTYDNLLKLVQNNDPQGVSEFLGARIPVDNNIIAAAAKTGDLYLLNMLLAEMRREKMFERAEKPMLAVLGTSHFGMVKALTELDQFQASFRDRMGRSWVDLAEGRKGPHWREEKELFSALEEAATKKERRSSSPVFKRDGGSKRRSGSNRAADDSEEDDTPKRKNGRRLMSKRDIRRRHSVASSLDDFGDAPAAADEEDAEENRPSGTSPSMRSTSGRKRTASFSAAALEPSAKTRRRSSSLHGPAEASLPTVDENTEEAPLENTNDDAADVDTGKDAMKPLKVEEDAEGESEQAATQLAAEEEQARVAEEKRKADEARREEENRVAEAKRKAEEDRQRVERELTEAKRVYRERVLASMPSAVAHALNPDSSFDHNDEDAAGYLTRHLMPLQVFKSGPQATDHEAGHQEGPFWVINVQAAPLVGPRGLELLLGNDSPEYAGSWAEQWETANVDGGDVQRVEEMLCNLPHYLDPTTEQNSTDDPSHEQRIKLFDDCLRAFRETRQRLRSGQAVLRYVLLDDVLHHLHPSLRGVTVDVYFIQLRTSTSAHLMPNGNMNFVDGLAQSFDQRPRPRKYVDGQCINLNNSSSKATVEVRVRHRK